MVKSLGMEIRIRFVAEKREVFSVSCQIAGRKGRQLWYFGCLMGGRVARNRIRVWEVRILIRKVPRRGRARRKVRIPVLGPLGA